MRQRGSLRLRRKTWLLRLRRVDETGTLRWKDVRIGSKDELPTKHAARRAADRYLERINPRVLHAGTPMEWGAWCDAYLARKLALKSKGTRDTQSSIIECHLRPAFADLQLHEIDRARIEAFVLDQANSGAAPSTAKKRFGVLRRMMRAAAEAGLACTPPTLRDIEMPAAIAVSSEVRQKAFSEAECQTIFDDAVGSDRTAFMLGRYLGLRGSEICGLTWAHVDTIGGAISVRQQALDGHVRPLKTKGSEAVLQAPPVLLEQLRDYWAEWQDRPNTGGFLFADATGRPQTSQELRTRLHLLLDARGLRRRGLHGFRHACALAMADAGVNPEAIRRAMRHSSLRVTAIYLRVSAEDIAAGLARGARRET